MLGENLMEGAWFWKAPIEGGLQEVRTVFGGTCNRGRSTRGEDGIRWDLQ